MFKLIIPTEELLLFYFNGELDTKIKKYKNKIHQKWPDRYYNTLNSVQLHHMKSDTNNIGDPTGGTAAHLADLSLDYKKMYETLVLAQKVIKRIIRTLSLTEIETLKLFLKKNKRRKAARSIIKKFKNEMLSLKKIS